MSTDQEVQRLAQVYQTYQTSKDVQARWSHTNPGNRAIFAERQRTIADVLGCHDLLPLGTRTILEIGCGSGNVLASLRQLGVQDKQLHGVDLLGDRVQEARQRYANIDFQIANAEQLQFANAAFDLVLLFTVFSSILDRRMAYNVASEVDRVLKPGGAILWYDFRYNNPRNPHVRGMTRSAIQSLFPGFALRLSTLTLLPPLARRLGWSMPMLYPLLLHIRMLRTHYLGLLIKRQCDE
jgi:SAM-dependent methyltransferase